RQLISEHFASASTKRTAPLIAEAPASKVEPTRIVQRTAPPVADAQPQPGKDGERFGLARARSTAAQLDPPPAAPAAAAAPGASDPTGRVRVKPLTVKPTGPVKAASVARVRFAGIPRPNDPPRADVAPATAKSELPPAPDGAHPAVLATLPTTTTEP